MHAFVQAIFVIGIIRREPDSKDGYVYPPGPQAKELPYPFLLKNFVFTLAIYQDIFQILEILPWKSQQWSKLYSFHNFYFTIFVLFLPYCRPWVGWLSSSQFLWCWSLASTGRGLYFIFIYAPLSTGWRRPRPRENLDLRSAPSSPQRMSGGQGFQHFEQSHHMYVENDLWLTWIESLWFNVMSSIRIFTYRIFCIAHIANCIFHIAHITYCILHILQGRFAKWAAEQGLWRDQPFFSSNRSDLRVSLIKI